MFDYSKVETIHESDAGFSSVYKIRDNNTQQIYALKVLGPLCDKMSGLMFEREINALYRLNEVESIVRIYTHEIGSFEGTENMGMIVLEYIDGKTIDQCELSSMGLISKLSLCFHSAEAILAAHNNNVLHRDIKPSNVMALGERVKIIDFGISKIKSAVETASVMFRGTENYIAPEVARGNAATEKSDIYSLGAVFFHILFNKTPKDSYFMAEEIEKAILEKEIKELLCHMLEENPENRLGELQVAIDIFHKSAIKIFKSEVRLSFKIDSDKIDKLIRENSVEDLPFAKVTAITLRDEFEQSFAKYDKVSGYYEFVGKSLLMKCNLIDMCFNVVEIYPPPTDTLVKLQSRFLEISYDVDFSMSEKKSKNVNSFVNELKNFNNARESAEHKKRMFNSLFNIWKEYLKECIESSERKAPKLKYRDFTMRENHIDFVIDEYKGGDIDNLNESNEYSVEAISGKKKFTVVVGTFYGTGVDGDDTIVTIKLSSKQQRHTIVNALKNSTTLLEGFSRKIANYKKQLIAISKLESDDYKSRNIKEIILELEKPTRTQCLEPLSFHDKRLDEFQRNAVQIAIEADTLALIQGPPGTGKTSVIKEIIRQVLDMPKSTKVVPKILLVSQSHTAVDNVLEGFGDSYNIVRIGDESNISEEIARKFTISVLEEKLFSSIEDDGVQYFLSKLAAQGFTPQDLNRPKCNESRKLKAINKLQSIWFNSKDVSELNYHLINSALIIAGTCMGYLSNEHVREMVFDYVIVDEAAKASTPELIMSIINSKKIIFVGDHYQLPPFSDSSLSVHARTLATTSQYKLFDLLYDSLPDTHKQILKRQYRMIKNIGDMISEIFYDDIGLETGIGDEERLHGITKYEGYSIIWFDTSKLPNNSEKKEKSGSFSNQSECDKIIKILTELSEGDNAKDLDVGVITGYKAQKNLLYKMARNLNLMSKFKFLDINTVDAFQGRENDIIIFSTVRTEKIGFLKEKERVNVAFSRAKKLLMICGDFRFISNFDDEENRFIIIEDYIKKHSDQCMICEVTND